MNGVDYTKQLNRDRRNFDTQLKKTKDAAEREISDINSRADHVIQKQANTFNKDRAELESTHQKSLNKINTQTNEALDNKAGKYNKDLNDQRDQFSKQSHETKREFDKRLQDIKSGYDKQLKSERETNIDTKRWENDKYNKKLKEYKTSNDNRLKEFQDKTLGMGNAQKDQLDRERAQQVRSHEEKVSELHKDHTTRREELKNRISDDIAKTRAVNQSERAHHEEYSQQRIDNLHKNYAHNTELMQNESRIRNDELVQAQQEDTRRTNQEHQSHVSRINQNFAKELRDLEIEKRRRDNGSGQLTEVVNKQQGANEKQLYEAKLHNNHHELVKSKKLMQEQASREQDSFNATLKMEKAESLARNERKLNEAEATRLAVIAEERNKAKTQIDARDKIIKSERTFTNQQLMLEKDAGGARLEKLKDSFNKSMRALEEKNTMEMAEVTRVTNADKSDFMRKVNTARTDEIFEMKREFDRVLTNTVHDYENRLSKYQADNELLKMTMDEKINAMTDQSSKDMASMRKMFEDKRTADLKAQQQFNDQREAQLRTDNSKLHSNYQRKMDKMQVENDAKLKLLTNDYETKLKDLTGSSTRALAKKDQDNAIEIERIKQTFEDEKHRIVSRFESQIEDMRHGHKTQMDSLKENKRLS